MALSIEDCGVRGRCMAKAWSAGRQERNTWETIAVVSKRVKVPSYGPMALATTASGTKTRWMDLASFNGKMADTISASGLKA